MIPETVRELKERLAIRSARLEQLVSLLEKSPNKEILEEVVINEIAMVWQTANRLYGAKLLAVLDQIEIEHVRHSVGNCVLCQKPAGEFNLCRGCQLLAALDLQKPAHSNGNGGCR